MDIAAEGSTPEVESVSDSCFSRRASEVSLILVCRDFTSYQGVEGSHSATHSATHSAIPHVSFRGEAVVPSGNSRTLQARLAALDLSLGLGYNHQTHLPWQDYHTYAIECRVRFMRYRSRSDSSVWQTP
jgi:hypothetical protein